MINVFRSNKWLTEDEELVLKEDDDSKTMSDNDNDEIMKLVNAIKI